METLQYNLATNIIISNWQLQNTRFNNLLGQLTAEQLLSETAPGRNTGVYILGHLTAVNDGMLPLLGLQDKLYPELQMIFIDNADKAGFTFPSIADLKNYWKNVTGTLQKHFDVLLPGDWFTKHAAISEEEFSKDPKRNKLNVVANRTNHLSYHLGQLIYLKK